MSAPFNLKAKDWTKIATGAGMAAVGIFGGVAIDQIAKISAGADLGTTTGILVAGLCSVGANLLRKWMTQTT